MLKLAYPCPCAITLTGSRVGELVRPVYASNRGFESYKDVSWFVDLWLEDFLLEIWVSMRAM